MRFTLFLWAICLLTCNSLATEESPIHYQPQRYQYLSLSLNGSSDENSPNTSSSSLSYEEKTQGTTHEEPELEIVPFYRPAEEFEKIIDRYIFQPFLFGAGSSICLGLLEALHSGNMESGVLPLEIGVGILGATLAIKTLVRLNTGAIELHRHCQRQHKHRNGCC